jgi:hypothetical protein
MKAQRLSVVTVGLALAACATGVTPELIDEAPTDGDGGGAGTTSGGKTTGGPAGMAGMVTNAFGGTATTGGKSSGGASGSAGSGGASNAGTGSGGKAAGGSAGASSAGTGSGGKAMGGTSSGGAAGTTGSGGSGGSVVVGSGSCSGTATFAVGLGTKYAANAKVVAVCMGGTPCTLAMPAGTAGKMYEFSCLDQYNCGGQDPGTTNWGQPPWQLTKACTP